MRQTSATIIATIMVASRGGVEILNDDGELLRTDYNAARAFLQELKTPPLLIHAKSLFAKLDMKPVAHFELLELFAFVHPAEFCIPTVQGIYDFLHLESSGEVAGAASVPHITENLLQSLRLKKKHLSVFLNLAQALADSGWNWGAMVLEALRENSLLSGKMGAGGADNIYAVWDYLTEWQEGAPPNPASDEPVSREDGDRRLSELLGASAEMRHSQHDYCAAVSGAFTPKHDEATPNLVLAEGGTGIGKTYGYLAPATLWSEANGAPVWVSTYTRNLQHQIHGSLEKSYGKEDADSRTVIRKGRENYLCLLNYAEVAAGATWRNERVLPTALIGLWILHSRDGDLGGGDFPSWLIDIIGRPHSLDLADKRGECIYSSCRYYRKCFIESSIRKARSADIVIANHALMIENFRRLARQAEEAAAEDEEAGQNEAILRAVFDEGHHLFHCADSAFSAHLSGASMADLRRWLIGSGKNEKGLEARLKGLLSAETEAALHDALRHATILPAADWRNKRDDLLAESGRRKAGKAIEFLRAIYKITSVRADKRNNPGDYYGDEYAPPSYGTEAEARQDELFCDLLQSVRALHEELQILTEALTALHKRLHAALQNGEFAGDDKNRARRCLTALRTRALEPLATWLLMLQELTDFSGDSQDYESFSWLAIERYRGRLRDIGYYRHYIDPMRMFSDTVLKHLHGCVITSATLTDDAKSEEGWQRAYRQSGASYLSPQNRAAVSHYRVASPFDYGKQSGVIVINDLDMRENIQVATAFASLFSACGGGALGIFTAIRSLLEAHPIIRQNLSEQHIPLYAQHVDGYHLPDLLHIFKHEVDSCLLGTDALRDGVDVPGRALRLVVFDKVPWQRRSLLLKARCGAFGREYDEMLARLALRQAFGRLIRSESDRGLFVILDKRLPSRLATAFPEGVAINKMGLAEAVKYVNDFLI